MILFKKISKIDPASVTFIFEFRGEEVVVNQFITKFVFKKGKIITYFT